MQAPGPKTVCTNHSDNHIPSKEMFWHPGSIQLNHQHARFEETIKRFAFSITSYALHSSFYTLATDILVMQGTRFSGTMVLT